MTYVETILQKLPHISKWQHDFLGLLLPLILALPGRLTFRNMSRYSDRHERTFARHFSRSFDWRRFNLALVEPVLSDQLLLVTDCTFVPKSGTKTYGLDRFWNGSAARTERGLELSVLARPPASAISSANCSMMKPFWFEPGARWVAFGTCAATLWRSCRRFGTR
jgi:putative transposase